MNFYVEWEANENVCFLFTCFSEIVRDDLEQVKNGIQNIRKKLETLKSSETEDKGQFWETNS